MTNNDDFTTTTSDDSFRIVNNCTKFTQQQQQQQQMDNNGEISHRAVCDSTQRMDFFPSFCFSKPTDEHATKSISNSFKKNNYAKDNEPGVESQRSVHHSKSRQLYQPLDNLSKLVREANAKDDAVQMCPGVDFKDLNVTMSRSTPNKNFHSFQETCSDVPGDRRIMNSPMDSPMPEEISSEDEDELKRKKPTRRNFFSIADILDPRFGPKAQELERSKPDAADHGGSSQKMFPLPCYQGGFPFYLHPHSLNSQIETSNLSLSTPKFFPLVPFKFYTNEPLANIEKENLLKCYNSNVFSTCQVNGLYSDFIHPSSQTAFPVPAFFSHEQPIVNSNKSSSSKSAVFSTFRESQNSHENFYLQQDFFIHLRDHPATSFTATNSETMRGKPPRSSNAKQFCSSTSNISSTASTSTPSSNFSKPCQNQKNFTISHKSQSPTSVPSSQNCSSENNRNPQLSSQPGSETTSDVKCTSPQQSSKLWPAWVYCTRYSDRPSSGPRTRKPRRKLQKSPANSSKQPISSSSSSSSSSNTTTDDKRPRTAFNQEQLAVLRKEFSANQYLTEERRMTLSASLGLNESQIKIWFQNKRAKLKKSSGVQNRLAAELMAQGLYNHSTVQKDQQQQKQSSSPSSRSPIVY